MKNMNLNKGDWCGQRMLKNLWPKNKWYNEIYIEKWKIIFVSMKICHFKIEIFVLKIIYGSYLLLQKCMNLKYIN